MNKMRHLASILASTARNFIGDYCFRHSAALSFYTLFSLAPMVLISAHVASLFAAGVDFEQELVQQFAALVGTQGAQGITVLLENLQNGESTRFRLFIGGAVLLFSATNIFVQLQDAFNEIFSVRSSGTGFVKRVLDRLVSLGIILSLGLVMILSLVIDSSVVLLQSWLVASFPGIAVYLINLIQYLMLALLATAEIYALLHFLPDVYLPRHYKLRGCAVIIVLLVVGKSAISWYIGTSRFSELGGAAASVIVLMLWIYYSSLIVFLGAEVIKSMALVDGLALQAKRYAVRIRAVVVAEQDSSAGVDQPPGAAAGTAASSADERRTEQTGGG